MRTTRRYFLKSCGAVAVGFAGSQKTLMVGLTIALQFGGLTILPMLAYHVLQLLIDTLLANRLRLGSQS